MKTGTLLLWGPMLLLASIMISGCGSARRGEPLVGPLRLEETQLVSGRQVFLTHCQQCHPGGEAGLGPALNNKPLPDFLVRLQVRRGLGVMPAFSEDRISHGELEDLTAYLRALRNHQLEKTPGS
jgi:mono/diheme cytochrome c family protein